MLMLKKFAYGVSTSFLKLTLFLAALLFAAWAVFGNSQNIKTALSTSGLYSDVVSSALDSAQQNNQPAQQNSNEVPINQPEIKQVIQKAFPAEFLQTNSEVVLDGIYGWLSGKTPQPEFSVDITAAKQQLISGVGDYAQNRYASLPLCTLQQTKALKGNGIDPLNIECRSPLVSGAQVKQQVESELAANKDFLNKTVYTGADLPKVNNQQPITEKASAAPQAYSALKFMPLLFGLLSILFAVGVVLLSKSKSKGLGSVGRTLVITGGVLFIATFATNWLFNKANYQILAKPSQSSQIQTDGLLAVKYLVNQYNKNLQVFYITYIVLGALLLGALWYRARGQKAVKKPEAAEESATTPPADTGAGVSAPAETQQSAPQQQTPSENTEPKETK